MNGKSNKLPVNYSVKNIIDSILLDNRKAQQYSELIKKKLYNKSISDLEKYPELLHILSTAHMHRYPVVGADFFARIGILPPELVIIDQRIKNMCTLPYWTVYRDTKGNTYRRFDRCPGYGWLPGCPPNSTSVEEAQNIVNDSTHFIVLQTKLLNERWTVDWKFAVLHRLAREIETVLGKSSVTGRFGSGPCSACKPQHCLHRLPCQNPQLKTTALESMGICVDRLCNDLALLTGNKAWKLTWLKHFGLPQQTPAQWKYVEALSIRLS